MNKSERTILEILLREDKPLFAVNILLASGSALSRGTIYINLATLAHDKLIEAKPQAAGSARYVITEKGREMLDK
jgi:DNA-binding PadR family transcriptional regulator